MAETSNEKTKYDLDESLTSGKNDIDNAQDGEKKSQSKQGKRKAKRKNRVKEFFREFGNWLKQGDVINVAIAFVVGLTFRAVVTSFVNDIAMPIFFMIGGVNLTDLSVVLNYGADGVANVLRYGTFIQTIVDFLITALALFIGLRTFIKVKLTMEKSKSVVLEKLEALRVEEIRLANLAAASLKKKSEPKGETNKKTTPNDAVISADKNVQTSKKQSAKKATTSKDDLEDN